MWSPTWGGLRFVDMFAGDVLSLAADGNVSRRHVGSLAAALRPRRDTGGAVIAVERGFVLEDAQGHLDALPELWTDSSVRMNDGGCDPQGRFYCGSMAYDQAPGRGRLFRLGPDRAVSPVLDEFTVPNGLDWSPDGGTVYHVDSATRRVFAYDYGDGDGNDTAAGFSGKRVLAEIADGAGSPDGLTVDADGYVWVALYAGHAVHRYSPTGGLDGVIELPVSRPTACTFGGDALDRLFITTTRENLPPDAEPAAGSLYAYDPGVRGRPVRAFAG